LFVGVYLCVSAVLNYNAEDSDQRDMVTNMRLTLPARLAAHARSKASCLPETVSLGLDGDRVPLQVVSKMREKLSDPRLLLYTEVLHPIVIMRQTSDNIEWAYHTASDPTVAFPALAWDASLPLNITFQLTPGQILQSVQVINSWPALDRPVLSYRRTPGVNNDERRQVWNVDATFSGEVRAYKLDHSPVNGTLSVSYVSKVLIETRFDTVDVPATVIESNAASPRYNGGQPHLKQVSGETGLCDALFDVVGECRDTIAVPRIHRIVPTEWKVAWKGAPQDAFEAMRAMAPHSFPVLVEVRDMSQPRPYAPIMFAFGYPMFIGFGLTLGAFVLLFLWCGLRCHLVNINARENQGLPPMFYQGMRRFRGW